MNLGNATYNNVSKKTLLLAVIILFLLTLLSIYIIVKNRGVKDFFLSPEDFFEGGYASLTSVTQGENINLHISNQLSSFEISIYREGKIKEKVMTIPNIIGEYQSCAEPGYKDGCGWKKSTSVTVPKNWKSGVYIAEFPTKNSGIKVIKFIVKEDNPGSTSKIIYVTAENTQQAYNYIGGKSLYNCGTPSGVLIDDPNCPLARMVSFNRPFLKKGDGEFYQREAPFVKWAENEGYVIEYTTSIDLHANPAILKNYDIYVAVGHDEYWTYDMRKQVDEFVKNGGKAIILSGNTMFRQVRLSSDLRTMYAYKNKALQEDPIALDGNPANDYLISFEFYKPPINDIESRSIGLAWFYGGYHNNKAGMFKESLGYGGYQVHRTNHWVFEGTGLKNGDMLGKKSAIVGYEVDGTIIECKFSDGSSGWDVNKYYCRQGAVPSIVRTDMSKTPKNFLVLGIAPAELRGTSFEQDGVTIPRVAVMGIMENENGGAVFNVGTIDWAIGLGGDATHPSDPQVQRITKNVLDKFSKNIPQQPNESIEDNSTKLPEIIIDNKDSGFSFTGNWQTSGGTPAYGQDSVYSNAPNTQASWIANIEPGEYEVYAWWTVWPSRASNAPYMIYSGSQLKETVRVNQNQSSLGGKWNLLGKWNFEGQAKITLMAESTRTYNADAVRFVKIGPLAPCTPSQEICDNNDNNCNGVVDEGSVCAPPQNQSQINQTNLTTNNQTQINQTNNNTIQGNQSLNQSTNNTTNNNDYPNNNNNQNNNPSSSQGQENSNRNKPSIIIPPKNQSVNIVIPKNILELVPNQVTTKEFAQNEEITIVVNGKEYPIKVNIVDEKAIIQVEGKDYILSEEEPINFQMNNEEVTMELDAIDKNNARISFSLQSSITENEDAEEKEDSDAGWMLTAFFILLLFVVLVILVVILWKMKARK